MDFDRFERIEVNLDRASALLKESAQLNLEMNRTLDRIREAQNANDTEPPPEDAG